MMRQELEHRGFKVVAVANVTEALSRIATEWFDVLITDLHMPNPGDGFTAVSAMRHSQTGHTHAASQRLPRRAGRYGRHPSRSDEIIVKPLQIGRLTELVNDKCSIVKLQSSWLRREWA
jgi:CheY-like chemotaxis protein